MAEHALSVIKSRFTAGEIATMGGFVEHRLEVGDLPFLHKAPLLARFERGNGGEIFNPIAQGNALNVGKGLDRIFADVDEIFGVTRAVSVIATGFVEPIE